MKKYLFLLDHPGEKKFFNYKTIFGRKNHIKNIFVSEKTEIIEITDDFFSGRDVRYSNHKSFILEEKIYNINCLNIFTRSLEKNYGKEFKRFFLGRGLVHEINEIIMSLEISKKIKEIYNVEGKIYIYKKNISNQILKYLKNEIINWYGDKFLFFKSFNLYAYDIKRVIGGTLLSLLLPLKMILLSKNKSLILSHCYKLGVHLYPGNTFTKIQPMDFMITDDQRIKNTLFIIDYLHDEKWEMELRKKKYNFLNFKNELIPSLSKYEYLKNYFFPLIFESIKSCFLICRFPWIAGSVYKHLNSFIGWKIFFDKTSLKSSIRAMIKGDLTSILLQKKNGVTTNFCYFSITSQIINEKIEKEKSDCIDYSFMIFDNFFSTKVSNNWIKDLQNSIQNYHNLLPYAVTYINKVKQNKKILKKEALAIEEKKVVSCFDHTLGFGGMMNFDLYYQFWFDLNRLNKMFSEFTFIIKTKKFFDNIKLYNKKISQILNEIDTSVSWINSEDLSLNTYDLISISDIVISAPVSSVIFESYLSNVRTISYDPISLYSQNHRPANSIENLSVYDFDNLIKVFNKLDENVTRGLELEKQSIPFQEIENYIYN